PCSGTLDRANDLAEEGAKVSLAPSELHWAYRGFIQFMAGNYEGVVDAAAGANDIVKTLAAWKAAALVRLGRPAEARDEAQRFLNKIRSCWFGDAPPTDVAIARWLLH